MEELKTNNKSLISIITPLYNAEKYFSDTFHSVINQTYQNWEWIIVNDCSTDNSLELAIKLKKEDKRIKIISLEKNSGPSAARNAALNLAKGDYISFIDSDDMWGISFLEEQLNFIKKNNYHFVYNSFNRLRIDSEVVPYVVPLTASYDSILKGNPICPDTVLYDFKKFNKCRFNVDLDKKNDREGLAMWYTMLKKENCIAYGNPKVLATYRLGNNTRSSKKLKLISGQWRAYREKLLDSIFLKVFIVFAVGQYMD